MPTDDDLTTLLARRKALADKLDAIWRDIGRGLDADPEERAIERENAEVLDEIARVTTEEFDIVEARITQVRQSRQPGLT